MTPTAPGRTDRRYLMCEPVHYTVSYEINPWMDKTKHTDADLAVRQWRTLRDVYLDLGHTVETIEPIPGLPDMVYAANGSSSSWSNARDVSVSLSICACAAAVSTGCR